MTLGTELIVTALVYFIIYDAYTRGIFRRSMAFGVLIYEALFNITYMISRIIQSSSGSSTKILTPYDSGLAIFHGVFSLLMFFSLIVFFIIAAREYARGNQYFRAHTKLTILFLLAWAVSVLSGILFFVKLYLL